MGTHFYAYKKYTFTVFFTGAPFSEFSSVNLFDYYTHTLPFCFGSTEDDPVSFLLKGTPKKTSARIFIKNVKINLFKKYRPAYQLLSLTVALRCKEFEMLQTCFSDGDERSYCSYSSRVGMGGGGYKTALTARIQSSVAMIVCTFSGNLLQD